MGLFDHKWGSDKPARQGEAAKPQSDDEQAIARYRYMLKTAPPEVIEQAHAEAFAQLTPERRRLVLQKIAEGMPASERALAGQGDANPQGLARMATRGNQATWRDGAHIRPGGRRGPGWTRGGQLAGQHRRYGHRQHDRKRILCQ